MTTSGHFLKRIGIALIILKNERIFRGMRG